MPTKQITVCAKCGKKTCDGGLWDWVEVVERGVTQPLSAIPTENRVGCCTLDFGVRNRKALTGKQIGDRVTMHFSNWTTPADLTVEKKAD